MASGRVVQSRVETVNQSRRLVLQKKNEEELVGRLESKQASLRRKLVDLRHQRDNLIVEVRRLREGKEENHLRLDSSSASLQQLRKDISSSKEDLRELQKLCGVQQNHRDNARSLSMSLSSAADQLDVQLETLREACTMVRRENAELAQETARLKELIQAQMNELATQERISDRIDQLVQSFR